jgi:uncharacterized protein DUF1302
MRTRRLLLSVAVLLAASRSYAYFLDPGRNFDVRLRAYSQASVAAEDTREPPDIRVGDVISQRNFYNPEFDARLSSYVRWMNDVPGLSLLSPEEFKFRFAWWGFYDGIFDYLDDKWHDALQNHPRARQAISNDPKAESFAFNDENKNVRNILGKRNRINELYLDWTKGRFFFRIGRQAISWGESDTIALLDIQNPFDLTLGAPGFFMDIDEARIPLYTARSTVKLLDNWKWLSSLFADVYLVPGPIENTIPISTPSLFGFPYSSPGVDPQTTQLPAGVQNALHVDIVEVEPKRTWANSRWGARLTGVVAKDYTVSGWFFRTYPEAPTLLLVGPPSITNAKIPIVLIDDRGFRTPVCLGPDGSPLKKGLGATGRTPAGRTCSFAKAVVTELVRDLESVAGASASWFSQPLNGVIRTEAEFFIREDAFIPHVNLNPQVQVPGGTKTQNSIPKANYLRWTIGYDRFFFFRPLNPANSFLVTAQHNMSWNVDSGKNSDFRSVITKPCSGGPNCLFGQKRVSGPAGQQEPDTNWEDQYEFEHFFTVALQTDYLHGRLEPRITTILDPSGVFAFSLSFPYRITDYLIFTPAYYAIEASRRPAGLAVFRDRDQFQFRITYQLN